MGNFRRHGAIVRPGKKIDFKEWTATPGITQDFNSDQTFVASGNIAFGVPGTILRVRGVLFVSFLTSGLTADDQAAVVFGLGIFSNDAIAAGAGSLPDPSAEPEYPWMWYGEAQLHTIAANVAENGVSDRLVVDTKAMRKFKPGEGLVLVGQYVNITGLPNVVVTVGRLRVLIGT